MSQVHEMIYMKMTNGEYVYGTNKAIGLYSVENNCECEYEFEHVPAMKLSGQGGYSEGSTAFKFLGFSPFIISLALDTPADVPPLPYFFLHSSFCWSNIFDDFWYFSFHQTFGFKSSKTNENACF